MNINQLKLKVNDTYEKDEKVTTIFEPRNNEDVVSEACLDGNLSNLDGHLSFSEKEYNQFELLSNKQSVEEVLIQRAVKTTRQIFYDKGLFDKNNTANAYEVSSHLLFVERRRPDLEEVNIVVQ